jgi:hypothetical protein
MEILEIKRELREKVKEGKEEENYIGIGKAIITLIEKLPEDLVKELSLKSLYFLVLDLYLEKKKTHENNISDFKKFTGANKVNFNTCIDNY